jgi:hypothetical protein
MTRAMLDELLPPLVLAVGLTGHRTVGMTGAVAEATEHSIGAVLDALKRALPAAMAQEAAFYAAATPVIRLITMAAEGAELLGARAAVRHGLKISGVIPFAVDEYRNDFSPAAANEAAAIFAGAESLLELPGRRDEGPRAYERANDVMLSNIDVLVAVWNGGRAHGRAGTGDVVQDAVTKGVPIIVIDPQSPAAPGILAAAAIDDVEPPVAGDLARRPLPADLSDFLHGIVGPPSRRAQRRAFTDLIAEAPQSRQWRVEYSLLLKTLAPRPGAARKRSVAAAKAARSAAAVSRVALPNAKRLEAIDGARKTIDALAVEYGQKFRSSAVSAYLVVILGAWVSGVLGLLIPALSSASIAVQLVANALVIVDTAFRGRRRWQERWLDYRVVAERLRWLRFRHAFGLGGGRGMRSGLQRHKSWIDWYIRRIGRALGPPQGKVDDASIAAAVDYLSEVEIPDQIDYHRGTFRQLGLLERRLFFGAHAALLASLGVAVVLAISAVRVGSLDKVSWREFAIVLLAILPATMTSLNGLRVDADLGRLVERSAQTMALLFRVRRSILASPRHYDHVAANMQRLASIMMTELEEWRFVIESRRARRAEHQLKSRKSLFRSYTELQKRLTSGDADKDAPPGR